MEAEVERPLQGPADVVTHHAPHAGSVAARFARDPASAASASDLGRVSGAALRRSVHGHVTTASPTRRRQARPADQEGSGLARVGARPGNGRFDPHPVVELPP